MGDKMSRVTTADEIKRLQVEVSRLREWIRETGSQFDICTHSVLRGVCDGCKCKRAASARITAKQKERTSGQT